MYVYGTTPLAAERAMRNKKHGNKVTAATAGSVLSQKDADEFRRAAKKYAKSVTVSKTKARSTLVNLGLYTKSGKLARRYG